MQRVGEVRPPGAGCNGIERQFNFLMVLDDKRRVFKQGIQRPHHIGSGPPIDTSKHPLELQDHRDRNEESLTRRFRRVEKSVDDCDLTFIVARENAHQQVGVEGPHRFFAGAAFVLSSPVRESRMALSVA